MTAFFMLMSFFSLAQTTQYVKYFKLDYPDSVIYVATSVQAKIETQNEGIKISIINDASNYYVITDRIASDLTFLWGVGYDNDGDNCHIKLYYINTILEYGKHVNPLINVYGEAELNGVNHHIFKEKLTLTPPFIILVVEYSNLKITRIIK